jgi:hypothetical protein
MTHLDKTYLHLVLIRESRLPFSIPRKEHKCVIDISLIKTSSFA